MRNLRATLVAAHLALGFVSAQAAPLIYDEGRDGDLADTTQMLQFDLGSNRVLGSMLYQSVNGDPVLDMDSFSFQLNAGQRLSRVTVRTTFTDDTANTAMFESYWYLYDSEFAHQASTCHALVSRQDCPSAPTGGELFADRSFEDRTYRLTTGFGMLGTDWTRAYGGSIRYELSFDVSAVPEPGSLAMFAAGAAALAALRRRRQAR